LPGQTLVDLQDEMRRHLDAGYALVKMKVGGVPLAEDIKRVEAVLAVVGSGERLAVDANCKFDRAAAFA
jgi:D(-)-tartrate dehydratase